MNDNHKYTAVIIGSLLSMMFLVQACKKDEVITGVVARETYWNNTGHNMTIRSFMNDQPAKTFTIHNEDSLMIETSIDAGADSTGALFRADSAVVEFADGKTYYMTDTTVSQLNFLQVRRTISPSGKIHYYRYTFSEADYNLAK